MFKFLALALLPALFLAQPGNLNRAIEALFSAIDINDDRHILIAEAHGYLLSHDTNEDGQLSHAEFNTAIDHASFGFHGHEAQVYSLFNQDNVGQINTTDINNVFDIADRNNDSRVSDHEFHVFFTTISTIIG